MKNTRNIKERTRQKENPERSLAPSFSGARMLVEITNICNHRCAFCPCKDSNRSRCNIDEGLFYRLADEGLELGISELGLHIFGEPLLNQNVAKYIKYSKSIGIPFVYMTTNGSLATPGRIEEIFEAGLDSVKFSINAGSAKNYLAVHGKDDFELVRQNLAYCHDYRKRSGKQFNIFISCVLTRMTVPEIPKIKEIFSKHADDVVFARIRDIGGEMADEIRVSDDSTPIRNNGGRLSENLQPCPMSENKAANHQ